MSELNDVIKRIVAFRDERDWAQFHNPKDLALALSIEAGELNECFLWKEPDNAKIEKVKEELADVLTFGLLLVHHYKLDPFEIVLEKLALNASKYPVEKAKGTSKKYNEL